MSGSLCAKVGEMGSQFLAPYSPGNDAQLQAQGDVYRGEGKRFYLQFDLMFFQFSPPDNIPLLVSLPGLPASCPMEITLS